MRVRYRVRCREGKFYLLRSVLRDHPLLSAVFKGWRYVLLRALFKGWRYAIIAEDRFWKPILQMRPVCRVWRDALDGVMPGQCRRQKQKQINRWKEVLWNIHSYEDMIPWGPGHAVHVPIQVIRFSSLFVVVLIRPDFFLSIEPLADGAIERFMSKNGARCPVLPALSSVLGLGAFISSIPLIMVIIVKPIIMVIIIIPSPFLSARLFSHSRKSTTYSTP